MSRLASLASQQRINAYIVVPFSVGIPFHDRILDRYATRSFSVRQAFHIGSSASDGFSSPLCGRGRQGVRLLLTLELNQTIYNFRRLCRDDSNPCNDATTYDKSSLECHWSLLRRQKENESLG